MNITKCVELIKQGVKDCNLQWDVDYRYYNNGLEAVIDFDTTLPNGKQLNIRLPYVEGDNPSHIGIALMNSIDKNCYDETESCYIEDLAWKVNQSY